MSWLEFTVSTTPETIEATAAALTAGGFGELQLEDQQEAEEFLEETRAYWDYIDESLRRSLCGLCRIRLYLEDSDESGRKKLTALLDKLRSSGDCGTLETRMRRLADTDWSESWKENYPPQPVGEKLLVLPCWLQDADTGGRLPVILNPGLTFGTGAHPSTRMVMAEMEACLAPGTDCLDLGSGSGILSVAALRLGAKSALGVDIDPKAEDIARENAAYNGYGAPAFTALTGNITEDKALQHRLAEGQYGLVLVNIVADVIIRLAPVLPSLMGEDTELICSGILDTRLAQVQAALEQAGFCPVACRQEDEWRCIRLKRRKL